MFDSFLHEIKKQSAVSAVVTILLGLVLLLAPFSMVSAVLGLMGWVMAVIGIFMVVSFVLNLARGDFGQLVLGVVQLLAGMWVIRHPYQLTALAANIVAGLVLIHAIRDLQYAFDAHRAGAANWWLAAIAGGLTLLLALLVILNPVGSAMKLVSFGGACLLVDGISDLFMLGRLDFFG
jgi:uncharacterized membrane protein HdeD (DUF308 family)